MKINAKAYPLGKVKIKLLSCLKDYRKEFSNKIALIDFRDDKILKCDTKSNVS
jgi:hypothetical protein